MGVGMIARDVGWMIGGVALALPLGVLAYREVDRGDELPKAVNAVGGAVAGLAAAGLGALIVQRSVPFHRGLATLGAGVAFAGIGLVAGSMAALVVDAVRQTVRDTRIG